MPHEFELDKPIRSQKLSDHSGSQKPVPQAKKSYSLIKIITRAFRPSKKRKPLARVDDVSDRSQDKKVIHKLAQSSETSLVQGIVSFIPDPMCVMDFDGHIYVANDLFCEFAGVNPAESNKLAHLNIIFVNQQVTSSLTDLVTLIREINDHTSYALTEDWLNISDKTIKYCWTLSGDCEKGYLIIHGRVPRQREPAVAAKSVSNMSSDAMNKICKAAVDGVVSAAAGLDDQVRNGQRNNGHAEDGKGIDSIVQHKPMFGRPNGHLPPQQAKQGEAKPVAPEFKDAINRVINLASQDLQKRRDFSKMKQTSLKSDDLLESLELFRLFMHAVDNDVRETLIVVIGGIDLVQGGIAEDNKVQKDFMAEMKAASYAGIDVLNDLHTADLLLSGTLTVRRTPRTILSVLETQTHSFRASALNKGIYLGIDNQVSRPQLQILADEHLIVQVFRCIMTNAIKVVPSQGTIVVRMREVSSVDKAAARNFKVPMAQSVISWLTIEINDTGPGFSEVIPLSVHSRLSC